MDIVTLPYWSSVWLLCADCGLLPYGSRTVTFCEMYALFAGSWDQVNVSCCRIVPPDDACCTKELSSPTCHAWYCQVFVVIKFHVLLPTPLASTSVILACTVGLGFELSSREIV